MRFWNKSLMARLVGYFLLLSLLTVALVGYAVYARATEDLKQSVFDRLAAVASLKEDALTRWIDEQRRNVVFIAWMPNIQAQARALQLSGTPGEIVRRRAYNALHEDLAFVVTSMSDAEELFILDMEGTILLSTDKSHEGYTQNEARYFVQGRSNTYVQPFYTSPFTGKPIITVATPLFDEDKRRVGVLAAHLNPARVDRIIEARSGLGQSGATFLVNRSKRLVSAPSRRGSASTDVTTIQSEGIDMALQGNDGAGLYLSHQGTPVVGVYRWLDEREVALLAEMSQAEAFAPARRMASTILAIGLLSATYLAIGLYVLARQIAQPIVAMAHTASQVAAGDLTQTAPVITEDEVGMLGRAFNAMTAQLRVLYEQLEGRVAERTADLTEANSRLLREVADRLRAEDALRHQNEYLAALHETALGVMSRLDLQDLFEDLVTRAAQLLDTSHGFIFTAVPDGTELECRVGVGQFHELIGTRVRLGEGLSGKVWETGQPIVVDDYDVWPGRLPVLGQGTFRAGAGVPLTSGSQTVGVLGLGYEKNSVLTFGDEELELLERFAALASIAIDNARLFSDSQQARGAAEAANASKSEFLANVSHELRTPLTSILGFARLVKKRLQERISPFVPEQDARAQHSLKQLEDNLDIILAEGHRLTSLINDLLDLEKIEAGKVEWHFEPLHIATIIGQAAAATATLFEEKGLVLNYEILPDLPRVNGDRDRLVQVVINLFSNAVKFTPTGSITVRACSIPGEVVVSVIDSGIGIAADDLPHLFEKFKQVGNTLTDKPKGTGLGLAICREILTHHRGRIWVESELGIGSTFAFALPY